MKHALIEITDGLVLKISATSEANHVVAKAALNTAGARLLYHALGEYLGLKAKSTGRRQTTMFAAEALAVRYQTPHTAGTVPSAAVLVDVVRLPRGGRK